MDDIKGKESSEKNKVYVDHLPSVPLNTDPILSSSKARKKLGVRMRADFISKTVGEYVLRETVVNEEVKYVDSDGRTKNTMAWILTSSGEASSSLNDLADNGDYRVDISRSFIDPISIVPSDPEVSESIFS
ncbi:hypothetical protein L1987_46123 [Smallanthus sonchifolius]|uniref:Uncharacterized protein n=1 Tax=Smallanthus sonchifolius TaxID=185202 RepID=A0ACB9FZF0_9ASTR|nr:hypothetical protein L1987_46123 [Smallanthus sonchifolius]